MYLLLAVQITSRFMQRMPRKVWHTIHLSSFLIFASATIHGALAGADRSNLIVQWLALTGVTWVSFLAIFRLLAPSRRGAGSRVPAGAREQAAAARSAQIGLGDTPIEEAVLTDSVEVAAVRAARASATRDRIPPEARRRAAAVRAGDGSEGDQWAAPKPEDSAQYVKLEG
jgi:DMSO/TMAO reductase YedYZ heme-binding membrane subunit